MSMSNENDNISADIEIFSVRIVTADFYLQKPILGLDSCYSQFQGKEIRQVPIIRIFGANSDGIKTCMHIHGVFPYFYIPYESKDLGDVDSFCFQLAGSIDKAINVTLGQASSQQQHVFQIQPVKGIPFYGYHRKEHLFLKIFMYNPKFIKRSANILQNGAIFNKIFQPHESHVPFILQFLIDHNLYGMDFLHVPKDEIKIRKNYDSENQFYNLKKEQILNIDKISTSKLEIDINSVNILNRLQLIVKNIQNCNPGIEAIWRDEKYRRDDFLKRNSELEMPSLEPTPVEERVNVYPTNSELFYTKTLKKKLESVKNCNLTLDSTLNENIALTQSASTSVIEKTKGGGKCNLSKLLTNSVYPEECSQKDNNLFTASMIISHDNRNSLNLTTETLGKKNTTIEFNKIVQTNSLINEDLELSFTQKSDTNSSLIHDDEVLEIMRQLENDKDNNDVDLDSTLAPLSQEQVHNVQIDSDDEDQNFTMANEDIDEILSKLLEQSTNFDKTFLNNGFPQLDGGYDETHKKNQTTKNLVIKNSPRKSARKRTMSKYKPLEVIINSPNKNLVRNSNINCFAKSSNAKGLPSDDDEITPAQKEDKCISTTTTTKFVKIGFKNTINNQILEDDIISISSSDSENKPLLDKTISVLTCNLKPTKTNEKRLKTYNIKSTDSTDDQLNRSHSLTMNIEILNNNLELENIGKKSEIIEESTKAEQASIRLLRPRISKTFTLDDVNNNNTEDNNKNVTKKKTVNSGRKILTIDQSTTPTRLLRSHNNNQAKADLGKLSTPKSKSKNKKCAVRLKKLSRYKIKKLLRTGGRIIPNDRSRRSWSPSDVAREYDQRNNFFPEAGPSHIDYYQYIRLPPYNKNTLPLNNLGRNGITETILSHNIDESLQTSTPVVESNNTNPFSSGSYEKETLISNESIEPFSIFCTESFDSDENNKILQSPKSEYDLKVTSFYEKSFLCGDVSPSIFSNNDSPTCMVTDLNCKKSKIILKSKKRPPTYQEVLDNLKNYQILEYKYQEPFYGNPLDSICGNLTEVGQKYLKIPTKLINNLAEHKSLIPNLMTLNCTRELMFKNIVQNQVKLNSPNKIKEYFCSQKILTIFPYKMPPTRHDAQIWLKAKELIAKEKKEKERSQSEEDPDSPIEVSRKKLITQHNNDSDNEFERNTILTPLLSSNNSSKDSKVKLNGCFNQNSIEDSCMDLNKQSLDNTKKHNAKNISNNETINSSEQSNKSSVINTQDIKAQYVCSSLRKQLDTKKREQSFGLSGSSLNDTYGFKINLENLGNVKADIEHNYLTIMSSELFVITRKNLKPNPEIDPIICIFYSILNNVPDNNSLLLPKKISGCVIFKNENELSLKYLNESDYNVDIVESELDLINKLLEIVQTHDPDIMAGYEVEMSSFGYILDRGKFLNMNLYQLLSRIPTQKIKESAFVDEESESFSDFEIKLCGRILLNVWRLMRSEIALTSYTFENIMYHILHRRCPAHSFQDLTQWYQNQSSKWIVFEYYKERVNGTLELLNQLDLIGRTSEMAKLIGIQFYEVLSRGSQYRVESMMLRMAKPKNLVPISPSVQQRAHMRAPEYIPLILEPDSRFYADPLIVLDFQSLYPSMIIAYNYCFSTCLGRVEHLGQSTPFEFGAYQLKVSNYILQKLIDQDKITISPCGVVFIKSNVREGILPRMLREILDTRLMVKQSMKIHKNNSGLQRVLHSRQLGLKLMANVTYGYTAANFSGRMPSVEVGDSVVSKGRETLERAIKLVESNEKWGAKVVYGDTDSLFVLCPGRSRKDAFQIGAEIAEVVTNENPYPVKLKLEKVYQPSILQTKKRYVGYMYENAEQNKPIYEAKGIETVRRDGCPAVAKMLEKSLRILFDTCDVSQIKKYVCRQFTKLLQGKANIQDLIFAKEFRGRGGYKPGACVPSLELTKKFLQLDPRNEPRRGERVPYVIINGPPGVPLIRLVRSPYEILSNEGLKINSIYYITKAIIPPLNRCLLLIGADVNDWFAELPRKALSLQVHLSKGINDICIPKKTTISQYFSSKNCICDCGKQALKNNSLCQSCVSNPFKSIVYLENKISKLERSYYLAQKMCQSCCGRFYDINCNSLDCPVLYVYKLKSREFDQIPELKSILKESFPV